jgi:membrane protease YdiL (CAAX protease family)
MDSSAMTHTPSSNWRLAHGGLFVLIMAFALLIPVVRQWPWLWIIPMSAYFLLLALIPQLGRSFSWLRIGCLTRGRIAATAALMICTALVLLIFQSIMQPETALFHERLLVEKLGNVFLAGTIFATVNAVMEELVFRGILFDAVQSQWGPYMTLAATSVLFGLGHLHGYPPGPIGAGLAMLFGLALGGLRLWTGGLLSPILAHMAADATIYCILVSRT